MVGGRHDARQELDHGDLGTQPLPDRAQLEPDIAGAHDHQVVGNLVERKRPVESTTVWPLTAGTAGSPALNPVASKM